MQISTDYKYQRHSGRLDELIDEGDLVKLLSGI